MVNPRFKVRYFKGWCSCPYYILFIFFNMYSTPQNLVRSGQKLLFPLIPVLLKIYVCKYMDI